MTETEQSAIRIITASQTFEGHKNSVFGVAVFPDRRRMVTSSYDKTVRLWDLENGVVLKIMEGHRYGVGRVAVSRDGQFIASGDYGGEVIAWNRDGESLTKPIRVHTEQIYSLDFSPDSTLLASGSKGATLKLWNTKTWEVQENPINCGTGAEISCVRYSPSGELLAIATSINIQIWNPSKRERIKKFQGHSAFNGANMSLAWTPNGTRLLSSGSKSDPTIREWDTSTWMQVGQPWKGHTGRVLVIVMNPTRTLLASASQDHQVRLWRLSDRRTIAIFKHTNEAYCATFSADGKHILSGGEGRIISKWAVPSLEDIPKDKASHDALREDTPKEQVADNSGCEILTINTTARDACITGDLATQDAHKLSSKLCSKPSTSSRMTETEQSAIRITTPSRTFEGHQRRVLGTAVFPDRRRMVTASFDKTLRLWDLEADGVLKIMEGHRFGVRSLAVSKDGRFIASGDDGGEVIAWNRDGEPITKPIKVHFKRIWSLVFSPDSTLLASGSYDTTVKLWNTKTWQVQENPINCGAKILCIRYSPSGELLAIATGSNIQIWNPSKRECIKKFQGHSAFNGANNFSLAWTPDGTRLLSSGSKSDPTIREWDTSTWMQVGQPWKGHTGTVLVIAMNPTGTLLASPSEDHQVRLWRLSDRRTIAIFKHTGEVDCATFSTDGKHILSGGSDRIISKWAVPSLEDIPKDKASHDALREDTSKEQVADNSACEILTINTTARDACITGDWDRALDEALKVIKLTPSSHVGYQFRHAALHGAQRYDEAIEAFKIMLSKLENAPDTQTRKLRQQYIDPSEAERDIQVTIKAQLDDAPDRLLNTFTGRLCNREGRIDAFKTSTEYKELFSSTLALVHVDLRMERIKDVVEKYFRYVTLSHRWEVKEPLLNDIQGKGVDELNSVVGIVKLQSFCKTARAAEHRWGWIDTCCIDQTNNVELQTSLNSMFDWYHTSALTMVYLSDVSRSSNPGALARSAWNTRGWTLPELLAPKVIRFYQNDWTPYLDDHSDNHKLSDAIVQELKDATGIDAEALADFSCRKINARKKLQWASTRVTTKQEDIAYSLFGIFDVQIHLMYGEKKEKALGRFLEKVVAELGDISALDWVGQSSKFNSCLPADITSYKASPYTPPPLSEHDIQTSISLLRRTAMDLALKLYDLLENLKAPRFADRRLHLPCIAFRVTAVKRSRAQDQEIYEAKADGLHDLLITTKDNLIQFSPPQSTMHRFVLVRPCNRYLDLPDFAEPSGLVESVDSKLSDRALRLTARLAQPFGAFLLAHQHGTAYKRIAPDHDIIAQVKNLSSIIPDMVKTLEIL